MLKLINCSLVGCLLAVASTQATGTPPNVLLITSEDHGPELGCYGEPFVKTPNLDAMARGGVQFNRAFVTQAGCSPSRSTMLTGLYPHQNGQIGLATWGFRLYREDMPTLSLKLREAGYRTGIIGKLHINPESAFPFDFKAIPGSNFNRERLSGYVRNAATFMGADDRPFFLMVNYPDAHRPHLAQVDDLPAHPLTASDVKPLAYMGVDSPGLRQDTADHYNCLMRLDTLIGNLLGVLEKSGKAENTLVIYLADHGADLLRGKTTCYEGGLRVPLIVSWPGKIKAGQIREELVSTIDLYPTILEAAGASAPPGLPGRSLKPLLAGETPPWREYLFGEYHLQGVFNFYPQRSVRNNRYKLIRNLIPGIPNASYEFVVEHHYPKESDRFSFGEGAVHAAYRMMKNPPEYELYDLQLDPFEFHNLAYDEAHRETLDQLKKALADWQQATSDPLGHPEILKQLRAEIEATFAVEGRPKKTAKRQWNYPDYFFPSIENEKAKQDAQ